MSTIQAGTIQTEEGGPSVLTKQSASKAWWNIAGTGTIAIDDSFNVASIVDNGTGDYTINLTNDMSSASAAVVPGGWRIAGATPGFTKSEMTSASAINQETYNITTTLTDWEQATGMVLGDLAA